MPLYEVIYRCTLTDLQRDNLATAITNVHANLFSVSKLMVSVDFRHSLDGGRYVGGRRQFSNTIKVIVRGGPVWTKEQCKQLTNRLEGAWYQAVPHTVGNDGTVHVVTVMDHIGPELVAEVAPRVETEAGPSQQIQQEVQEPQTDGDLQDFAESWGAVNLDGQLLAHPPVVDTNGHPIAYASIDEGVAALQAFARGRGYGLTKNGGNDRRSVGGRKNGPIYRVYLQCEHSGAPRDNPTPLEERQRPNTTSKKVRCSFRLSLKQNDEGNWEIKEATNPAHRHHDNHLPFSRETNVAARRRKALRQQADQT